MIVDPYQRIMVARPAEWDLLQSYGAAAHGPPVAGPTMRAQAAALEAAFRASDARRFPGARPAEAELLWAPGAAGGGASVPAVRPSGDPVVVALRPTADDYFAFGVAPRVPPPPPSVADQVIRVGWWGASIISTVLGLVHGYRRNRGSAGWALTWGVAGGLAPVLTPALAYAQGFGVPLKK